MANDPFYECPVTPERADQCPATPEGLLSVKTSDSPEASINSNANVCPPARETHSPPPNCAICLGKCQDKCFTDSCTHIFCFKCLQEWSKVKPECPLCKKIFKIIIHNAHGENFFDEYFVPAPIIHLQTPEAIPHIPMPPDLPTDLTSRRGHFRYAQRFDVFLSDLPSNNEILRSGFSATVQVHPSDNDALQGLFLQRAAFISEMQHHSQVSNEVIHSGSMGQIWRRFIYEKKLYALPVVDITGRFRECTARFYRDNPAQTHRLMPWLNRDLVCLLRDTEHHVSYVLNVLSDLLNIYNLTSPEFRRRCIPYLGRRTSHFIHEFVNFARSPYDMVGYDREVRYAPYYEEVILSSSDLDNTSSSESEPRRRRRRRRAVTEFTLATRSDFTRFFLTDTFDGFSALPNFDMTIDSGPINLTVESNEGSTVERAQPQVLGQNSVIQIDRDIVLSSDSSDECEFVMEQKPPHLRTPELVMLNSDSDSDVVYVGESPHEKASSTLPLTGKEVSKSRKRKYAGYDLLSGASDQDETDHSDYDVEDLDDDYEIKAKIKKVNDNTQSIEVTENKVEGNTGASTSSGIGSVESRTNSVKKYARTMRKPRKGRRTGKSIFEGSTSDSDQSSYDDDDRSSCEYDSDDDSDSSWSGSKNHRKHRRRSSKRSKHHKESKNRKKSKKSRKKSRKSKRCKKQRIKKYVFSTSSSSASSPSPPPREYSPDP